jgi:signal transduction histidine kinase
MAKPIKDNPEGWANEGTSKIRRNGEALLHLVNQMLDLLKLEAGTMSLHAYQQDVIVYLKYLIESFSAIAICKNISLKISSNIPSLLMDFDSEKLSHIISNLLCNALKFTHEGGMIEIIVEKQTKDTLWISVIDNGIGIDKEHIPRIFDRFYKVENNKNEGDRA